MVEDLPKKNRPIDTDKAELVMGECERHCNFANPDVVGLDDAPEWEEKISKCVLTKLFFCVVLHVLLRAGRVGRPLSTGCSTRR